MFCYRILTMLCVAARRNQHSNLISTCPLVFVENYDKPCWIYRHKMLEEIARFKSVLEPGNDGPALNLERHARGLPPIHDSQNSNTARVASWGFEDPAIDIRQLADIATAVLHLKPISNVPKAAVLKEQKRKSILKKSSNRQQDTSVVGTSHQVAVNPTNCQSPTDSSELSNPAGDLIEVKVVQANKAPLAIEESDHIDNSLGLFNQHCVVVHGEPKPPINSFPSHPQRMSRRETTQANIDDIEYHPYQGPPPARYERVHEKRPKYFQLSLSPEISPLQRALQESSSSEPSPYRYVSPPPSALSPQASFSKGSLKKRPQQHTPIYLLSRDAKNILCVDSDDENVRHPKSKKIQWANTSPEFSPTGSFFENPPNPFMKNSPQRSHNIEWISQPSAVKQGSPQILHKSPVLSISTESRESSPEPQAMERRNSFRLAIVIAWLKVHNVPIEIRSISPTPSQDERQIKVKMVIETNGSPSPSLTAIMKSMYAEDDEISQTD